MRRKFTKISQCSRGKLCKLEALHLLSDWEGFFVRCALPGGESIPLDSIFDSKDGALQIRQKSCMPWPPSASTNWTQMTTFGACDARSDGAVEPISSIKNVMKRWRARAELLVFESKRVFGKQRDPKIKKRTVMNSILKAGTLQLFNDFHEYPGGPWINSQVLFRPFLKVTIQTTIKKRPERPCSILDAKPHFLPKKMTIPLKAVDPNAINQRQLCH